MPECVDVLWLGGIPNSCAGVAEVVGQCNPHDSKRRIQVATIFSVFKSCRAASLLLDDTRQRCKKSLNTCGQWAHCATALHPVRLGPWRCSISFFISRVWSISESTLLLLLFPYKMVIYFLIAVMKSPSRAERLGPHRTARHVPKGSVHIYRTVHHVPKGSVHNRTAHQVSKDSVHRTDSLLIIMHNCNGPQR